ncbi:hypothetical protein Acr_02g0002250 [Actinidia rufa]|uniref:RNase H type-1 domain-containing protein n=1 Tax=Actinidia rufa TaxID=165716 RepID=A0A7J0E6K5_9ERIC|nr:hypothetical protein Acr_02g0002250 [Actinidia rufa]
MFHFNPMAGNACFRGGGGGNNWIRVGWKPPSTGIFKLNTDGASKGNLGQAGAGAGGLIRNHEGRWVAGFCHNIGTTNSLEAEVTAIKDGLELVNRLGLTNVDVETDSKLAVQLIAGSIFSGEHVNNLVNDCRRLMEEIGSTTLRHVYREANACADILANLGVVADGLEVFANAPSLCGSPTLQRCHRLATRVVPMEEKWFAFKAPTMGTSKVDYCPSFIAAV